MPSSRVVKITDTIQPRCGCPTIHPEKMAARLRYDAQHVPAVTVYGCLDCGAAWEWGAACAVPQMPRTFAELLAMTDDELRTAVMLEFAPSPTENDDGGE
jgi:hypothetical protein